ncbi:MAG: protein kinase, partial [Pseudomonadota bacterium]
MKTCPICNIPNDDDARTCTTDWCLYSFPEQDTIIDPGTRFLFKPGDVIAQKYLIERRLGSGGMGSVYLVTSIRLDLPFALKVLHPALSENKDLISKFINEVRQLLLLDHPYIVRAHDYDEWQGYHFFTMEYVQGISLDRLINARQKEPPPFTVEQAIMILEQLLKALEQAHQQTIHRDIKPANIMIVGEFPNIQVKVLDFGIAKAMSQSRFEKSALAEGAFFYIAPEQSRGKVDIRSDLFSAGIVFYEMLTGEVPGGFPQLPSEIIPNIPSWIDMFVKKALSAKPESRFQTAKEMRQALMKPDLTSQKPLPLAGRVQPMVQQSGTVIPKEPHPETQIINDLGMKFVWIKPGTFTMGSPSTESYRGRDETQHQVTLTQGYYMMTTEVTQG